MLQSYRRFERTRSSVRPGRGQDQSKAHSGGCVNRWYPKIAPSPVRRANRCKSLSSFPFPVGACIIWLSLFINPPMLTCLGSLRLITGPFPYVGSISTLTICRHFASKRVRPTANQSVIVENIHIKKPRYRSCRPACQSSKTYTPRSREEATQFLKRLNL
jgi:hypothetical protein